MVLVHRGGYSAPNALTSFPHSATMLSRSAEGSMDIDAELAFKKHQIVSRLPKSAPYLIDI
jgi:hypothetical protein